MNLDRAMYQLKQEVDRLAVMHPMPLNIYIHKNYMGVTDFCKKTDRIRNTVNRQISKGAIYYDGSIYIKEVRHKT